MTVIKQLIRLYMHHGDAIEELKKCRLNPDFNSAFRNDLEFYIPQMCSFYLKGDYERPSELIALILEACKLSFFFSHRVWFFFQSNMYQDFQ